jgi:enterochelin esterase-like enzyme
MKSKGINILSIILITITASCTTNVTSDGGQEKSTYPVPFTESSTHEFADKLGSVKGEARTTLLSSFISQNPQSPIIESDSVFSLYWFGKAGRVLVNGDLQKGWAEADSMNRINVGESAFFFISYKVPRDSRLDYTLTIDSVTVTDPRNPSVTPSGYGPHSEIAMPGFSPDPNLIHRQDIPHGTIDSLNFASSDTSISPRQLKMYFPPGYHSMSLLPVIYVLDGLEALDFMSYQTVMDNMIADDRMTPAIVIFVPPGDRHNEKIGGKTEAFMKVICEEMVPLIDLNYSTDPRPEKRAITGISSGGHFALLTLFKRNDVFLNGAGQSPSITQELIEAMRKMIKTGKYDQRMKIYFDAGTFDLPGSPIEEMSFPEAVRSFHTELEMHKISHIYQEVNDGHEWANWRERTDDILGYFFPEKLSQTK